MRGEAECRAHCEAECRCTPFCAKQNRPLLFPSPFGCHQLAPEALAQRRFTAWSGRRGSNPRQPAWKAGTLPVMFTRNMHTQAFVYTEIYVLPNVEEGLPYYRKACFCNGAV